MKVFVVATLLPSVGKVLVKSQALMNAGFGLIKLALC
jgi:hypothetical protein